jgi:transposase InsO family protein
VLTDNGACYRSRLFRTALAGVEHRFTRPYTPRTNGKTERFNRTLLEEWAYVRPYRSEAERVGALDEWLHNYNHHRGHTSRGGQPPITALNNLAGPYS